MALFVVIFLHEEAICEFVDAADILPAVQLAKLYHDGKEPIAVAELDAHQRERVEQTFAFIARIHGS